MIRPSTPDILIVEDNPGDVDLTREALEDAGIGYGIRVAERLSAALQALSESPPDVVLLDLGLPDAVDMEGLTAIQRSAPLTPIVVISGRANQRAALRALESGAQDYVVKGQYTPELLARSIRYSIERKRTERELLEAARFDTLTGLVNRAYFGGLLEHALDRAHRAGSKVDLLFIDLDRFKNVNDSLGHSAGDELLRQVAARIRACVRNSDVVARIGGDEFTVMVEDAESSGATATVADKIACALQDPFDVGGVEVVVTPSIGIAGYPEGGGDAATLLQRADTAMYWAKSKGRNTIEFFSEEMHASARATFELEMSLRRAVATRAFELHYQPIFDRASRRITGTEALLRWPIEKGGVLLQPSEFLPILERTGLMRELGDWILYSAVEQCRRWQTSLRTRLKIAVNVSPRQLADDSFVDRVQEILRDVELAPCDLAIEITEEVLLDNDEATATLLDRLRQVGVRVAIDDFGTGYSSLRYLTTFPFDTVKIDRSFVDEVEARGDKSLITAGILTIAIGLGRHVIAEGVETDAQMDFLAAHRCPEVQGFLLSRPLDVFGFESLWAGTRGGLPA